MASSHGFGSTTSYSSPYSDSLSLRLRIFCLTSLHTVTRRPVLQKVRDHTLSSALSACKHTVSVSISLPFRGSFHLSLTLLVHYLSLGSIYPYEMVLVVSYLIPRFPPYSGFLPCISQFHLRDSHPLRLAFPDHSAIMICQL